MIRRLLRRGHHGHRTATVTSQLQGRSAWLTAKLHSPSLRSRIVPAWFPSVCTMSGAHGKPEVQHQRKRHGKDVTLVTQSVKCSSLLEITSYTNDNILQQSTFISHSCHCCERMRLFMELPPLRGPWLDNEQRWNYTDSGKFISSGKKSCPDITLSTTNDCSGLEPGPLLWEAVPLSNIQRGPMHNGWPLIVVHSLSRLSVVYFGIFDRLISPATLLLANPWWWRQMQSAKSRVLSSVSMARIDIFENSLPSLSIHRKPHILQYMAIFIRLLSWENSCSIWASCNIGYVRLKSVQNQNTSTTTFNANSSG